MSFVTGSAFAFPHAAQEIVDAIVGSVLPEDSTLQPWDPSYIGPSGDDSEAVSLLDDNLSAVADYLANQTVVTIDGVLDGSGNITVAHGLTGLYTVLLVQGFYNSAIGTYAPLALTQVDATNVVMTGGSAAALCRIVLLVSTVPSGW